MNEANRKPLTMYEAVCRLNAAVGRFAADLTASVRLHDVSARAQAWAATQEANANEARRRAEEQP